MDICMDPLLSVSAPPVPVNPNADSMDIAEDGTPEELKLKPLFTLGLRKAKIDEVEELPLTSLRKMDVSVLLLIN